MKEPKITINGVTLSEAEALTVRVALEHSMRDWQQEGNLGFDGMGEFIRMRYVDCVKKLRKTMGY